MKLKCACQYERVNASFDQFRSDRDVFVQELIALLQAANVDHVLFLFGQPRPLRCGIVQRRGRGLKLVNYSSLPTIIIANFCHSLQSYGKCYLARMSILYSNPLDSTGASDFTLDDPIDGTSIAYLPYHLVGDSPAGPTISGSYEAGFTATMTYIVASVTHARFIQLMLGISYVDTDLDAPAGNLRLFRTLPHQLPIEGDGGRIPAYKNMFASGVQNISFIGGPDPIEYISGSSGEKIRRPTFGFISNDTQAGNVLKYAYAVVTIQYTPYPYPLLTDENTPSSKEWLRFTTIQRVPRIEFLNVKAGTLKWIDAPALKEPVPVEDDRVPIRDGSTDYVVTWHRVPFCFRDFGNFIGHSNADGNFLEGVLQAPSGGFDVDTMLLHNVQETLIPNPWGDMLKWDGEDPTRLGLLFNYNFFFQYKPNGHNAAIRRQVDKVTNQYKFEYNKFSFTGKDPAAGLTGNPQRAIKQSTMAALFLYGSS